MEARYRLPCQPRTLQGGERGAGGIDLRAVQKRDRRILEIQESRDRAGEQQYHFQDVPGYLEDGDFVGADMARKYLQIDFTRASRNANY